MTNPAVTSGTDSTFAASFVESIRTPLAYCPSSTWQGHSAFAMHLMSMLRPSLVVELGVLHGFSLIVFAEAAKRLNVTCKIYGVDLWKGDKHAGLYEGDPIYEKLSKKTSEYSDVYLIKKDFHEARRDFPDGSIDLLHIDGLHTYEAVKKDFETYLTAMSAKGVVLFHDIAVHQDDFGVWKLWEELRDRYPSIEFDHSFGLGVLFVGREMPMPLREFYAYMRSDDRNMRLYRDLMAWLSESKAGQAQADEKMRKLIDRTIREKESYRNSRSYRIGFYLIHPWKIPSLFMNGKA